MVQFCERSETERNKSDWKTKHNEWENVKWRIMESMSEKTREWGTKREMWVPKKKKKKRQCQASFRHEWETMRPSGVWMVREHTYKHIPQAQTHTLTHTHPPHWARACASETGLWVYWGDMEGTVPFCRANEACAHKHKGVERVSTALLHPFTHFLPLHSSWWGNAFSLKGIPYEMHL